MKLSVLMMSLLVLASCSTAGPITATSNKVGEAKGEACMRNILFIIPLSLDNTIYSAAKDGDIKEISTVDHHAFTSIIYNSRCTVVHGNK